MATFTASRWTVRVLNTLALGVAAYAILVYALLPMGALLMPDMRDTYQAHRELVYGHVFGAGLALALGLFQVSTRLRVGWPRLHRWVGRAYLLLGVGVGGVCGLALSRHAQGGPVAQLGFAVLALAWLYTGLRGWRAIRAGRIGEHRAWMLRNHALTLAAVTLRIYLPLALVTGLPFKPAYAAIAWLCWVPNLLLAQRWLRGRNAGAWLPTMPR